MNYSANLSNLTNITSILNQTARNPFDKYGYSTNEKMLMVLITAITNFTTLPCIILQFKHRNLYSNFIGIFTLITSFMYHFVESIGVESIFLTELEWHRLDNIGSIACFIYMFTFFADSEKPEQEMLVNYIGLLVTIVLQQYAPWELQYTILPIFIGVFYIVYVKLILKKKLHFQNSKMYNFGRIGMCCAVVFFVLSQNEFKDYLRIYHGLWHMCIGISIFYVFQGKYTKEEECTFLDFHKKKVTLEKLKENWGII